MIQGESSWNLYHVLAGVVVFTGLLLSLSTWGIYVAAYFGKAGDEMELPLILLTFGTPIVAITGVVLAIWNVDTYTGNVWRLQFVASIVSAILAFLAFLLFFFR